MKTYSDCNMIKSWNFSQKDCSDATKWAIFTEQRHKRENIERGYCK